MIKAFSLFQYKALAFVKVKISPSTSFSSTTALEEPPQHYTSLIFSHVEIFFPLSHATSYYSPLPTSFSAGA